MALPSIVRPRRAAPVLVCRKCLKRSDDPKAFRKAIKHALRPEDDRGSGPREKPARIVMTSCFGLCPKRAVVVTGGVRAQRGEYVLVSDTQDIPGALALLRDDQNKSS
ncbi:conserved hypothetical protein [Bradyrhizobium oligotrophicum S58]|uniref:(2Fe-2S) ferredoxin domain-containing protein n=1 Tax=Bradyrhizobium oligotrophicum S58 TaxID=1245469 RepID=M4Z1I0_9BRAD|nr:hypothetical protein [Bradyrhizobium oligotrophicum]BAM86993.1 conserved hypothetical protein [Bradyrhizobium oligotrophicum S58]